MVVYLIAQFCHFNYLFSTQTDHDLVIFHSPLERGGRLTASTAGFATFFEKLFCKMKEAMIVRLVIRSAFGPYSRAVF